MNLIVRVINIRKHKKVTFLDVHNSDIGHQQIKLNNSEFIKEEFKLGDIIECECDSAKTEKGIDILNLKKMVVVQLQEMLVLKMLKVNV